MSNRSPITTEDGVPSGSATPLTPGTIVAGLAPYYNIAPGIVFPAPHAASHAAGGTDPVVGPLALKASTAAPNTAPIKIASGPLLTAPEAGAVEFLTDKAYLTITSGTLRKEIALTDAALTSGRIPFTTTNGRLTDSADLTRNATTGDITLGNGANLVLAGANALGEGNIVMAAAASPAFDTNLVINDSTAKTMGYICGATPAFVGTAGPFFGLRGNTYAAYANQRGNVFIYGGRPSAPGAAEGRVFFGTNDTERLGIDYNGTVKIPTGPLVLPKASGNGIKLDTAAPTFGWRDLTSAIDPKATGTGSPLRSVYRGTIYQYAFAAGDLADIDCFHIPHDYAPGTDLYVHVHWSHNGTAISGSAVFEVTMTYAKGHNQANFPAEVTQTITVATPDIATIPQYRHRVDEVQASTAGGSATLHNTTNLEVDGIFIGYIKLVTKPTITGGDLFIHTVDLHYQSTGIPTKSRAPNFYV